mmetsp:Transcript_11633/g.28517  ORF Transcript_11633/g.28517 Transcript_11633/m.28517 type:complete len:252 (+) Transcript_11633:989-1744(+)
MLQQRQVGVQAGTGPEQRGLVLAQLVERGQRLPHAHLAVVQRGKLRRLALGEVERLARAAQPQEQLHRGLAVGQVVRGALPARQRRRVLLRLLRLLRDVGRVCGLPVRARLGAGLLALGARGGGAGGGPPHLRPPQRHPRCHAHRHGGGRPAVIPLVVGARARAGTQRSRQQPRGGHRLVVRRAAGVVVTLRIVAAPDHCQGCGHHRHLHRARAAVAIPAGRCWWEAGGSRAWPCLPCLSSPVTGRGAVYP